MNSFDQMKDELQSRFGKDLQIISPLGKRFSIDEDQAFFILTGAVDLFFAERMQNGELGFSLPLFPQMPAGVLIPPMPKAEKIHFYGRCLPDTEIALLPWEKARSAGPDSEPFLWKALLGFAAAAKWRPLPENADELLHKLTAWCSDSEKKLQTVNLQTQELIQSNYIEQQRQNKNILSSFSSLLMIRREKTVPCDPSDPFAAAATLTAEKSGISDFTFAKGKTLEQRIERSRELNRLRITTALLKDDRWYREEFAPMMVVSADGKDAYCAFRNKHDDPVAWSGANGKFYVINRNFCKTLDPVAWNFVIPFPAAPVTPGKVFQFIFRIFKKHIPTILVLLLIGTILDMFVPVINSMIFAEVIPNADRTLLGQLFFLLLVSALAKVILDSINRRIVRDSNDIAERSLQMALFDHVLRLPVDYFRKYTPADMAMRTVGIQNLFLRLNTTCILTVFNALFIFFPIGMLFYYSAKLAMAVLGLLFIMLIVASVVSVVVSKLQLKILTKQGEISGVLERFIANIGKLHAAGAENKALLTWLQKFSEKQDMVNRSYRLMLVMQVIQGSMNWALFAACMAVIFWMYNSGDVASQISISDFSGFISAVGLISAPLILVLSNMSGILQIVPVFKWLNPLLTSPAEDESEIAFGKFVDEDEEELRGGIELDKVSFSYDGKQQILHNVSLKAEPGEFIAVTGESGAGKSTLLRLMLRFEKPSSGTVLYDGEDAGTKNIAHIRSKIGVVLQNAELMPLSILHNIIGTTSKYTEEDAWRAAEMAGCDEDIRSFPMQMQTVLTGSTISGGQQQRILLAHALIRNPRLIFLDEATSALDNRTQKIIIESLKKVKATKVVIAHRLSTIMDADRIYVLEHGTVVEVGTCEELMKKQGVFAKMAARQIVNGSGE